MLYILAPLLIIPLLAYFEQNWWFLIGIVIASIIAPQLEQVKPYTAGSIFLCAAAVSWFYEGFHNCLTFSSLCGFWGCMFFRLAEDIQSQYAIQSLKKNPKLFNEAIAQNRIMIIRNL